jgi:hypothetical protein
MSKYAKEPPPIGPPFLAQLEPPERRACRDYLWSQDIVHQQRIRKHNPKFHQYTASVPDLVGPDRDRVYSGQFQITRHIKPQDWLATRVAMIRKAWGLGKTFIGPQFSGRPPWYHHPATQMIVLWPEWPGKPYFEIPLEERLRRIEALATSEKDQWAAKEYQLNPHNPYTKKKVVIPIAICPDSLTLQAHREAFDAVLRIYAPELFSGTKVLAAKQGGRGSEEARVLDDLNAFIAYYLCQVQGLPRKDAIQLICYPKGHIHVGTQVYKDVNELSRPLLRFLHLRDAFYVELMRNLIPLAPDPLELFPDFTLLE